MKGIKNFFAVTSEQFFSSLCSVSSNPAETSVAMESVVDAVIHFAVPSVGSGRPRVSPYGYYSLDL